MTLAGGVYTRVRNWVADANGSIAIEATLHDTEDDSIAAALNLAIYRDGQAAYTANQPMGGFKFTNLGNGSADADSVSLGQANGLYLLKAQLAAGMPVNASLAASVGSNELTVALKTAAAADPSAASPVLLPFRSATAGTGTLTVRSVTAASSIVINSTALLGATNGVAFSLWVVAFDDAGTIRLAAINCLSAATDIYPLETNAIATSTLEDNAADSAHVFYSSGAAVTAKPYVILGRLIWTSGLTTAGTWDAVPSVIVNFGPGVNLPNETQQRVVSVDAAVATGTTQLPVDDTIPQNTEGDQYMSKAITPSTSANLLRVVHQGLYAQASITLISVALFQDSTANALHAVALARNAAADNFGNANIDYMMRAGTTSATTFKIRAGSNSATTLTFNGQGGLRRFGGVSNSMLSIEEIVA